MRFKPDALAVEAMVWEPVTDGNPSVDASELTSRRLMSRQVNRTRSSEPIYVLDATPIIHFAKIEKLKLVLGLCEAYMTREVYREVVERGQGRPDAMIIRDSVERGELKVYDLRNRNLLRLFQRHPEIHLGEAETIAAARELNACAVIDEAEARTIARTYGVKTRTGTLFLLFKLLALRRIRVAEGERILDELVESGLYVDSQTLIRAKQKIRSMSDKTDSVAT